MRPVPPDNLRVDQISSRTSRVTWSLANRTADEGADNLILRVTFSNHSLAELRRLSGDVTSVVLDELIPAHEYLVVLTAVNSDGEVTTNPTSFSTTPGNPAVSSVDVQRVNRTSFVMVVHLAYTGGGAIRDVEVSYKPNGAIRPPTSLMISMEPEPSSLMVRVTVILTDQDQQRHVEHEAAMALIFTVRVNNEYDFWSDPKSANGKLSLCMDAVVSAFVMATTSQNTSPTPSVSMDTGEFTVLPVQLH